MEHLIHLLFRELKSTVNFVQFIANVPFCSGGGEDCTVLALKCTVSWQSELHVQCTKLYILSLYSELRWSFCMVTQFVSKNYQPKVQLWPRARASLRNGKMTRTHRTRGKFLSDTMELWIDLLEWRQLKVWLWLPVRSENAKGTLHVRPDTVSRQ